MVNGGYGHWQGSIPCTTIRWLIVKSPFITQIDKYYLTEVGLMWYNIITIKPMLTEIQRKGDYYGKDL